VTRHRFSFAVWLVFCLVLSGAANAVAMPSPIDAAPLPATADASGRARLAQAQPAQAPAPAAAASPAQPATDEPIGNVATLTGSATVTRNNTATPLKLQDDIFLNDVLQTSANSTLGVTFNDATTFNLTANARITVDNYVYEDGGQQNAALFDVAKGTVAFVAAAVAKTGDMKISTPTATLGIRGTTGLVEVPEGASATNPNNVAIKLYPDPDGHVGRIEVNDRAGARLGFLTQGASGFAIRPGAMGRFSAAPLTISPQQALRDQGIVRQVHAAQSIGRQVVSQQRALRQANPNRNNNLRNNPARPPGPQRQNGLPQRPGSPGQPGLQRQGVQQAPGAPRPGLQNRPAQPRRLAAPPKGKPPPKQKR
jgi:FecR protein